MEKGKQVVMGTPGWIKDIKDVDVAGAIVGIMFASAWNNKPVEGDNLREYIRSSFDDMSEEQIEEVARLLIEHKVVTLNKGGKNDQSGK